MQEINFDEKVEMILQKDSRYARDAYAFVRESLDGSTASASMVMASRQAPACN